MNLNIDRQAMEMLRDGEIGDVDLPHRRSIIYHHLLFARLWSFMLILGEVLNIIGKYSMLIIVLIKMTFYQIETFLPRKVSCCWRY